MSFSYLMQRYFIAIDQLISKKPWKLRPRWGSGGCTIENSLLVRYQMLILFANPYSSWRHWNWIVAKIVIVLHSVKIWEFSYHSDFTLNQIIQSLYKRANLQIEKNDQNHIKYLNFQMHLKRSLLKTFFVFQKAIFSEKRPTTKQTCRLLLLKAPFDKTSL